MKVKELRTLLDNLPDDMEIILQKDSEGNGYSPLAGADPDAIYRPENSWFGDVFSTDWSAAECCLDEEEWEVLKKNPCSLILYPVN